TEVTADKGGAPLQTLQATSSRADFLDTPAKGTLAVLMTNAPAIGDWIEASILKTNGQLVNVSVTNSAPKGNIVTLTRALTDAINATPELQGSDGVVASDFYDFNATNSAFFMLYARQTGWPAAQVQVAFSGFSNLVVQPAGTNLLEDNLSDLPSRNHVQLAAGLTN